MRLVSVSCGSQNVWAVDHRGIVYFRVGTQPLNPSMMLPAWIHIEPPAQVRHAWLPAGAPGFRVFFIGLLWPLVCSQWECSWLVFRPALTTSSSGPWTTEELSLWELASVKRCQWELAGKWCQVCTCSPVLSMGWSSWGLVRCVCFRVSGQSAGHQLTDNLGSLH